MKSFGEWMNDMSESIPDASEIKDKKEEVLFNPFIERSCDQEAVSLGAKLVNKSVLDGFVYTRSPTFNTPVLESEFNLVCSQTDGYTTAQPYDDQLAVWMCSTIVFRQSLDLPPITTGHLKCLLQTWESLTDEERHLTYEDGLEDLESLLS